MAQANDSLEGRLLQAAVAQALDDLQAEEHIRQEVLRFPSILEEMTVGLAFCLSKSDDDLSQWRGYASNGEGFCIGFDRSALVALGKDERDQDLFSVIDVLYEPSEHQEIVAPIVKEAVDFAKVEIPNRRPAFGLLSLITETNPRAEAQAAWDEAARRVREKLFPLFDHAWRLKPRAFHGEREVRALVTELLSETHPLEFKNSKNGITFFREFGFNGRESSLIREIWIGPRNQTPIEVVKSLAKKIGAPDAEIKRSAASYR